MNRIICQLTALLTINTYVYNYVLVQSNERGPPGGTFNGAVKIFLDPLGRVKKERGRQNLGFIQGRAKNKSSAPGGLYPRYATVYMYLINRYTHIHIDQTSSVHYTNVYSGWQSNLNSLKRETGSLPNGPSGQLLKVSPLFYRSHRISTVISFPRPFILVIKSCTPFSFYLFHFVILSHFQSSSSPR